MLSHLLCNFFTKVLPSTTPPKTNPSLHTTLASYLTKNTPEQNKSATPQHPRHGVAPIWAEGASDIQGRNFAITSMRDAYGGNCEIGYTSSHAPITTHEAPAPVQAACTHTRTHTAHQHGPRVVPSNVNYYNTYTEDVLFYCSVVMTWALMKQSVHTSSMTRGNCSVLCNTSWSRQCCPTPAKLHNATRVRPRLHRQAAVALA